MSAHTPGPWTIIQLPSADYRIDAKQGPIHVCPAIAHGLDDARLIAAAPDLLEALQNLVPRFHSSIVHSGTDPEFADLAVEHARAAIVKATS